MWDFETGEQVGEPLTGHTDLVQSVAISDARGWVVSGSWDRTVRIWDMHTHALVRQLGTRDWVESAAVSDETNKVAAGLRYEKVLIWDLGAIDAPPVTLSTRRGWICSVAFSHDGRFLVSASTYTIQVWDVQTGEDVDCYERMLNDGEGDKEEPKQGADEDKPRERKSWI
jgi:WD40 repeat protein